MSSRSFPDRVAGAFAVFGWLQGLSLVLTVAFFITLTTASEAAASPYFVSPKGNNTDGRSWQTAWKGLARINWTVIGAGDTIYIDGGSTAQVYYDPIVIAKSGQSSNAAITIERASDTGRNGQVIIQANSSGGTGIEIGNNSYIRIDGKGAKGILVQGFSKDGVHTGPASCGVSLSSLEIADGQGNGAHLAGSLISLEASIVHDNSCNVLCDQDATPGPSNISFINCWIANRNYLKTYDGIRISSSSNNGSSKFLVQGSILGPCLKTAITYSGIPSTLQVTNCLFIDATAANIKSSATCNLKQITSYMTAHSPQGFAHACLNVPDSTDVNQSIFCGGTVVVAPGSKLGQANHQSITTGNTMALSGFLEKPPFAAKVESYPDDVTAQALIDTDFSIAPGSPATGCGASVISVKSLLKSIAGSPLP
jgi:hypothetical protein